MSFNTTYVLNNKNVQRVDLATDLEIRGLTVVPGLIIDVSRFRQLKFYVKSTLNKDVYLSFVIYDASGNANSIAIFNGEEFKTTYVNSSSDLAIKVPSITNSPVIFLNTMQPWLDGLIADKISIRVLARDGTPTEGSISVFAMGLPN